MAKVKPTIRDYEHYKKLRDDKVIKKKMIDESIERKYDIGYLQVYAWEARYKNEKRTAKLARKKAKK